MRRSLWDVVPRDQRDTPAACVDVRSSRSPSCCIGAGVLGWSLRIEPGSGAFYAPTVVLAVVWVVGAFASGRLHLGRISRRERT